MKKVIMLFCILIMALVPSVYADSENGFKYFVGDINADGSINIDDAVLLLQNSMFPEEYKLTYGGNVDFTKDKSIDIDDAVLLLQHSMFPDNYPIEQTYARYLMDDSSMSGPVGIMSGWRLDDKYQIDNTYGTETPTVSADKGEATVLHRPINAVREGEMRLDLVLAFAMVRKGAYVSLENSRDEVFFSVVVENSQFVIVSGNLRKPTGIFTDKSISEHTLIFDMNLDKALATVIIDNDTFRGIPFESENISRLSIGFDGSGSGSVTVGHARIVADYGVNENFAATDSNEGKPLYGEWKTDGNVTVRRILSERGKDVFSANMIGTSEAEIEFGRVFGRICAEVNLLLPKGNEKVSFNIVSEGKTVLSLYSENGNWYAGKSVLRKVAKNVWTNLRLEIDTVSGSVFVRINGKDCGTHKLSSAFLFADAVKISLDGKEKQIWFDDVKVFTVYDYPDYPEKPLPVTDDNYEIGVNVCNLWHNGYCGEGYDAVAPFDELYPYVGLADEGLPELADWEIKQMTEHGIDFQHICWYSPQNTTTVPVKGTRMAQVALNDGFLKSKYGDYMKFCIMWENSNGSVNTKQQFYDYIWPYFKEYYLSDPRYYSIDNKAVITIWNREQLKKSFGGETGARQIVDFMKEDVKSLGYDGLIVLFSGDTSISTTVEAMGGDGIYAYNYGRSGEHADYQLSVMKNNKDNGNVYYVPSVSVGFNAVGRHDERSGMITPSEHRRVCEYIKNEYLPTENDGSWHDNLVIVSTWNEYTEGTYVAPSNLYGFDYLDNVREVFAEDKAEHEDVIPSEKVKDRMRNLYPDGFSPIRRLRLEGGMETFDPDRTSPIKTWDFSDGLSFEDFRPGHGLSSFGLRNGIVYGSSDVNDFAFLTKNGRMHVDVEQTGAKYLHIRMKSDEISRGEMFFITDEFPTYNADACIRWEILKTGEFVDYYVDASANNLWNGIITGIRIDPMITAGEFEVELIEILSGEALDESKIFFDGNRVKFDFEPEYNKNLNDYMVTLNPRKAFFSLSHTYYEYNVDDKSLYVESLYGNVKLFENSDKAIVNGKEKYTGFVFTYRDGLPFVPLKWLMTSLGFEYRQSGNQLQFETLDKSLLEYVESRREGAWEFNRMRDYEGFTFQSNTGYVYDGAFNLETTGQDNAIKNMNLDIDLSKYSKVVVGISFKTDAYSPHIQIYFQTKAMSEMNERASVKLASGINDTKGKYVEYVFDMSQNADWRGTLTGLRLDPFHGNGTYSVDYIRLSK